MTGEVISTPI